jgi:hypothetical protein
LLVLTLAPLAYLHVRERPAATAPIRFQIPPAVELAESGSFALSPNGRHLGSSGPVPMGTYLWIRTMDSLQVRSLPGSRAPGHPASAFLVS